MYITPLIYNKTHKNINFKANNNFPTEKELLNEVRKGTLNVNQVNKEDGETLFQKIVANNYLAIVSYLTAKPSTRESIVNFSSNGIPPLNYAKSSAMESLLVSRGAKATAQPNTAQNNSDDSHNIDARATAAKIYMSNPVLVTSGQMRNIEIERGNTIVKDEVEDFPDDDEPLTQPTQNQETDYFNSFDEVNDNDDIEEIEQTEDRHFPQEITKNQEEISGTKNETTQSEETKIPKLYTNYTVLTTLPNDPQSIDDIIGFNNIKNEIKGNIIIPLTKQRANTTLKANNIDIPNGVLVETSENLTQFVKAMANETKIPVLQAFTPSDVTVMLNDIEKNYKETGNKTVILIRGFDKFFNSCQSGSNGGLDENNFLLNIENCADKGALIFATADDKDEINKKFLSAGVFDKVLELPKPTFEDRKKYLNEYFKDKYLFKDLENITNEIAEKTESFTYSDIEKVLEESARKAVSSGSDTVSPEKVKEELANFTKNAGIVPIDDYNKTVMYDTPEFKRIPLAEDEITKLDDLGGMPDVKEQLKNLYIEPFKHLDELKAQLGNNAIPDGAIFYGPAGNGKTLTAKVLARELGLPFYETKLSDVASSYIHESSKNIRKMAQQLNDKYAATGEMSLWFFDEFDSLGEARGENTASHKQEVTDTLLQEFNNPATKGFILIAATNDLDGIDPALKRRGRLGNWIAFSNPDRDGIIDVVSKELAKTPITKDLSTDSKFLEKTANEFDGSSMSSIVSVLTDAKRKSILTKQDFSDCIKSCFDDNNIRQMGEFCNKAGLKQHQYGDYDFNNLDELGGMEKVKEELQDNVVDIWNPEIRAALIANRRSIPGGVILEGPPGTGKTTIIETLARQMNVPLFKMNYAQDGNEYIHKVAKNVTDIFERLALQAKIQKKPVMLFFDEAEKFFPRYAQGHQVEEVNTYKELMNNAAKNNIILIGATNHIDMVNQEIIGNPRRMGTVIHVDNPDEKDRENLFTKLLSGLPILAEPITPALTQKLAQASEGLSIGEIADNIDKAIVQAVKKKENITEEQLLDAFK